MPMNIKLLSIALAMCVIGAIGALLVKFHNTANTAADYRICLAYSLTDSSVPDVSNLPESCKTIFTEPGRVAKLQFDNDQAWVFTVPVPVQRISLMNLHSAILDSRPDLANAMPDFDTWWQSLPSGGAPK